MTKKLIYIGPPEHWSAEDGPKDDFKILDESDTHFQILTTTNYKYWIVKRFFKEITEEVSKLPPGTEAKKLSNKAHFAYFDPYLEHEMGMGMRCGAEKHGWNNHRKLSVEASQQVLDSLKRHLNDFLREGPVDKESQTSHLACLINNANFLYRLVRIHGYDAVMDVIYGKETR